MGYWGIHVLFRAVTFYTFVCSVVMHACFCDVESWDLNALFSFSNSKSKVAWQNNPVPLPHIHSCHLLNYERQLPSVILSHCQYSLQVGKGQDISYDWPALEKDILGRFIHGKPLIQTDIPQVVYRKDIYTAATFAAVRKNVKPQVS